jgi:hypothetical protein
MTLDPRPDQAIDPPGLAVSPGGAAGVFRGRLIIVQGTVAPPGSGIFVYDATGNLIGAWVGAPGTDPIDHGAVQLGLTVQNASGTLVTNMQSGSITLTKVSGVLAPPSLAVQDDTVNTGNTPSVIDATGVLTSLVTTYDPVALDGTVEAWHSLGTLANYTIAAGRYRMTPEGELELDIDVTGNGSNAGTTTFGNTLPTAYRPAITRHVGIGTTRPQTNGESWPRLFISTAGGVQVVATASVTNEYFWSGTIPLT